MLLQILYDNLHFKDRVLTEKRVNHVEMDANQATAYTKDGSSYSGDILIGADGVHSAVRSEMWRNASEAGSELFKGDEASA
ncbi:hypothetical protein IMZ48_45850 [Candidatus Bathyarchaeota archaeon]|nr:hypothetical protein [Candidatus Bathyarchaeota archaeon]